MRTACFSIVSLARLLAPALVLAAAGAQVRLAAAPADRVTVRVDRPGAPIPSALFGLFFEDVNFAADGGLYPERVKNRSFEFPDPLMGWKEASSPGLGFFEYFQLCEDLGAEPLPVLNCGMACQFNSGELAPWTGWIPTCRTRWTWWSSRTGR